MFQKLSVPELIAMAKQLDGELKSRGAAQVEVPTETHKWWVCAGKVGESIDLAELVEEFRSVGATPVLHHTDKGVCIGVGIGKGWPGGIGKAWAGSPGITGGCFPKVLPADPYTRLDEFLSNKGFNPFRPYPPV